MFKEVPKHLIMQYHLDNKQKLINDYKYLNQLHEKLINQISIKLENELGLKHKNILENLFRSMVKILYSNNFDRWETVSIFLKSMVKILKLLNLIIKKMILFFLH